MEKPDEVVIPCEFAYYAKDDGGTNSIYLREGHNMSSLFFEELNSISNLQILERTITHQSIGPLEKWEDVTTSLGSFDIEEELDEGYFTINSSDKNLMDLIAAQLRKSPHFHERLKQEESKVETSAQPVSSEPGLAETDGIIEDETSSPSKFFYYPHEHGASISFNLDESFSEGVLFYEIKSIPGLEIIKEEITHQSFGPIEIWQEITTSLGMFNFDSTLEGFDTGYRVSSSNKQLMELIVGQLRKSPHFRERIIHEPLIKDDLKPVAADQRCSNWDIQEATTSSSSLPKKKEKGGKAGGIISSLFFLIVTLLIFSSTVTSCENMKIDLSAEKTYEGIITKRETDIAYGKNRAKNLAFNLRVDGLPKDFRFFNKTNNFDQLLADIQVGDKIRVYYSHYGFILYQIEKEGKVVFSKEVFESKQLPGVIMGFIFAVLYGGASIFIAKRFF